jgi:tetratricopeptide (TPR) repeat protein
VIARCLVLALMVLDADSLSDLLIRYQAEPQDAKLCEQIGIAYTRINDFDHAVAFFDKALRANPQALSTQKNLATVLWFSGHKDQSVSIFQKLEKRIPKDPVPQLYLGLAAYESRDFREAARHFDGAGRLASENPELWRPVVETYLETARFGSAENILHQQIVSENADSQAYRWLGDAYEGQHLPDQAFRAYSTAIEQQPEREENYLALAGFSIDHANLPYAREVLNRGLSRKRDSPKLLFELGLAWALEGNMDRSREAFLKVQAADSHSALPLLALGVIDLQTGWNERAAQSFQEGEGLAPQDYRFPYLRGVALTRMGTTRQGEADSELRRALELDAKQVRVRTVLASLENARGNPKAAEEQLRAAFRLSPAEPTVLYQLAPILFT